MTAANNAAPERYGNTRVSKILTAYNDLRSAVRSGDLVAAQCALDRYEPWADYVFDKRHKLSAQETETLLCDIANAYAAQGNMIAAIAIHDAALCLDVLAEVEQGDVMPLDGQMEWEPDGVCKWVMHTHFGAYKYDRSSGDAQTEGWVRGPNGECLGRHISSAFAKSAVIDDMRLKGAKAAAKNEVKK